MSKIKADVSLPATTDKIVTNGTSDDSMWGEITSKLQRAFIVYYTDASNQYGTFLQGTKSAVAAGYSENTAPQQSTYLLKLPKIRDEINARLEAILPSRQAAASMLYKFANANLGELAADISVPADLKDHPQASNLKRIKIQTIIRETEKETSETHTLEMEIIDPLAAAKELVKLLNYYDRTIFSVNINKMLEELDLAYATDEELEKIDAGEDLEEIILAIKTRQELLSTHIIDGKLVEQEKDDSDEQRKIIDEEKDE